MHLSSESVQTRDPKRMNSGVVCGKVSFSECVTILIAAAATTTETFSLDGLIFGHSRFR